MTYNMTDGDLAKLSAGQLLELSDANVNMSRRLDGEMVRRGLVEPVSPARQDELARPVSYRDFRSMLSEGFHTAFRKAIDGPDAMPIHRMIAGMKPEDWSAVIEFVANPLWEELTVRGVAEGKARS